MTPKVGSSQQEETGAAGVLPNFQEPWAFPPRTNDDSPQAATTAGLSSHGPAAVRSVTSGHRTEPRRSNTTRRQPKSSSGSRSSISPEDSFAEQRSRTSLSAPTTESDQVRPSVSSRRRRERRTRSTEHGSPSTNTAQSPRLRSYEPGTSTGRTIEESVLCHGVPSRESQGDELSSTSAHSPSIATSASSSLDTIHPLSSVSNPSRHSRFHAMPERHAHPQPDRGSRSVLLDDSREVPGTTGSRDLQGPSATASSRRSYQSAASPVSSATGSSTATSKKLRSFRAQARRIWSDWFTGDSNNPMWCIPGS